ncbi:hypothetical protein ACFDR9_005577, partial [Janthinobacterium sp. CG_23.3]
KVGYRQACYIKKPHQPQRAQDRAGRRWGFFSSAFCFWLASDLACAVTICDNFNVSL